MLDCTRSPNVRLFLSNPHYRFSKSIKLYMIIILSLEQILSLPFPKTAHCDDILIYITFQNFLIDNNVESLRLSKNI